MTLADRIAKRNHDLNNFIRGYGIERGILPTIQWVSEMHRAGKDWQGEKEGYERDYARRVIGPATEQFNILHPDTIPAGVQLSVDMF